MEEVAFIWLRKFHIQAPTLLTQANTLFTQAPINTGTHLFKTGTHLVKTGTHLVNTAQLSTLTWLFIVYISYHSMVWELSGHNKNTR